jgi:hypothetical protein
MIPGAKVLPVEVPEWDFPVYVRKWSIDQRANVFAAIRPAETPAQLARAQVDVVLWSACDERGQLLFSEADRAALEEDAWIVDRIANAARELNMPEKKSEAGSSPSASSPSNSPPISA